MARSLVASLIAAALLAGLLLAPGPKLGQSQFVEDGDALSLNELVPTHLRPLEFLDLARRGAEQPVGRYQLAAGGQAMLDTASGTLYRLEADRWQLQATLRPSDTAEPQSEGGFPSGGP